MAEEDKAENKEEGKDAPKDDGFQKDVADKLQSYEKELKTLKDSNLQLGQVLQDTNRKVTEGWQPAPKEAPKTFSELLYDDEEKAIQMIEDRTEARIMKKLGANQNLEVQRNKALSKLYGEYPELGSQDSESLHHGHNALFLLHSKYGSVPHIWNEHVGLRIIERDTGARFQLNGTGF